MNNYGTGSLGNDAVFTDARYRRQNGFVTTVKLALLLAMYGLSEYSSVAVCSERRLLIPFEGDYFVINQAVCAFPRHHSTYVGIHMMVCSLC